MRISDWSSDVCSSDLTQEMFLAAGVRLHVVARAFRRMTMLMLVHSGAGVTLVPGSFADGAMDGIVTRPVESGEHRMRIAAGYPLGDLHGGNGKAAVRERLGQDVLDLGGVELLKKKNH